MKSEWKLHGFLQKHSNWNFAHHSTWPLQVPYQTADEKNHSKRKESQGDSISDFWIWISSVALSMQSLWIFLWQRFQSACPDVPFPNLGLLDFLRAESLACSIKGCLWIQYQTLSYQCSYVCRFSDSHTATVWPVKISNRSKQLVRILWKKWRITTLLCWTNPKSTSFFTYMRAYVTLDRLQHLIQRGKTTQSTIHSICT